VYNFGFILLESLIGPVPTTKGEAFLLNEMVTKRKSKKKKHHHCYLIETNLVNSCCCNVVFADIIWEPRRSAENSKSNSPNNKLAGVFIDCDLNRQ